MNPGTGNGVLSLATLSFKSLLSKVCIVQKKKKKVDPTHSLFFSPLALSNVVVFSLKEDECGLLQYDIAAILNRFLACSATIDKYMLTPPPHYLALSDLPDDGLLKAPFQLKLGKRKERV
jgi:hypothetical protein